MEPITFFLFLTFVLFVSVFLQGFVVEGFLTAEQGYVKDSPLNNTLDTFVKVNAEINRLLVKLEGNQPLDATDRDSLNKIPRLSAEEVAQLKGQLTKLDQLIDEYVDLMTQLQSIPIPGPVTPDPGVGTGVPTDVAVCPRLCEKPLSPHPNCKQQTIQDATTGKCYMECSHICNNPSLQAQTGFCNSSTDCLPCGYDKVEVVCPYSPGTTGAPIESEPGLVAPPPPPPEPETHTATDPLLGMSGQPGTTGGLAGLG